MFCGIDVWFGGFLNLGNVLQSQLVVRLAHPQAGRSPCPSLVYSVWHLVCILIFSSGYAPRRRMDEILSPQTRSSLLTSPLHTLPAVMTHSLSLVTLTRYRSCTRRLTGIPISLAFSNNPGPPATGSSALAGATPISSAGATGLG